MRDLRPLICWSRHPISSVFIFNLLLDLQTFFFFAAGPRRLCILSFCVRIARIEVNPAVEMQTVVTVVFGFSHLGTQLEFGQPTFCPRDV